MSFFSEKNIQAFGLDISDTSVKVMQVQRDGSHFIPAAYASVPLSDKVINNHLIANPARLADNIQRAIETAKKIDSKYVVCSIPEAKSFVRIISIPVMPEDEIDGAIPYELEQDIPIPVDQVYLDWQLLRQSADKLDLLVSAAPKDYADSLAEALEMAQLRPVAMELESQATARALIGVEERQKIVLIVDMASQQTSFVIVNRGVIEYTSSLPVAGNALTESIARNLGLKPGDAETVKREAGLTLDVKPGVRQAILPILDGIIDEIKNVTRFFEEHDPEHKSIQSILLCGGTAHLSGIADYVSSRINLGSKMGAVTVTLGNPWINLQAQPIDQALGYATVVGLALRGASYEAS